MKRSKKIKSKQSRRKFLQTTAVLTAASTLPLFNINHAWSQDVVFDGQPFDANGATLLLGEWGGMQT